jgi:hypothetical protein
MALAGAHGIHSHSELFLPEIVRLGFASLLSMVILRRVQQKRWELTLSAIPKASIPLCYLQNLSNVAQLSLEKLYEGIHNTPGDPHEA